MNNMKENELIPRKWYKINAVRGSKRDWYFLCQKDGTAKNVTWSFPDNGISLPNPGFSLSQSNSSFIGGDYIELSNKEIAWCEEIKNRGKFFPKNEFNYTPPIMESMILF